MTDMTPEEINRRIAELAGVKLESDCPLADDCVPGGVCDICTNNKPIYPDYFRTNSAMDLLGVLVEKGYSIILDLNRNGVLTYVWHGKTRVFEGHYDTIPAAICRACLGVIEREGTI